MDRTELGLRIDTQGGPTESHPASDIGLRAERSGSDFRLTWNRNSRAATSATWGLLSIQDGHGRRAIPLKADQIRDGSVFYEPAGSEVRVELKIVLPTQQPVVESLTMLLSPSATPPVHNSSAQTARSVP